MQISIKGYFSGVFKTNICVATKCHSLLVSKKPSVMSNKPNIVVVSLAIVVVAMVVFVVALVLVLSDSIGHSTDLSHQAYM